MVKMYNIDEVTNIVLSSQMVLGTHTHCYLKEDGTLSISREDTLRWINTFTTKTIFTEPKMTDINSWWCGRDRIMNFPSWQDAYKFWNTNKSVCKDSQ